MTVVCAVKSRNDVVLGCDSWVALSDRVQARRETKIMTLDLGACSLGLAGCGAWRFIQLLRFDLPLKLRQLEAVPEDPAYWIATTFARSVRACVDDYMQGPNAAKRWELIEDSHALVGFCGRIFHLDPEGETTCEFRDDYAAIGAGAEYALGALAATTLVQAEERIGIAVSAAAKHSSYVRLPVHCKVVRGVS